MSSGLLSNLLPHLVMTIVVPLSGLLADLLRMKKVLNTTTARKIFGCGGFGGEAVFLLLTAYAGSSTPAIVGIGLALASSASACSALNANLLDIAPRQAAILMGWSNTLGTLAAILSPVLFNLLSNQSGYGMSQHHWMGVLTLKLPNIDNYSHERYDKYCYCV